MSLFDGALDALGPSGRPTGRWRGEARVLAARIEASAAELQHLARRLGAADPDHDDHAQLAHWQSMLELLLDARPDTMGRSDAAPPSGVHGVTSASGVAPTDDPGVAFVREGDVWTIGAGRRFRLRHSKGLMYLARLLAEPGRELHALDLASPSDPSRLAGGTHPSGEAMAAGLMVSDLSGPGEAIDAEARSAYKGRIRDLRVELDDAATADDATRAEAARTEIEWLTSQLASAYGLGGRARSGPSPAERARQSVSKAIRVAVGRIHDEDADLGAHLARSVRTGMFCCYDPDPAAAPRWSLRPDRGM